MRRTHVLPLLALVFCTGCRFGEARFESNVQGRSFDPSGTSFSYLDAHDDALTADDNPRVVVALTWIIFDPRGDLNDLEGSALEDYSHELKLRDALALVFDAQGDVTEAATFKSVVVNGEEQGDGELTARIHLAPERLDDKSTYADLVPLASKRTTDVTITAATFADAAPVVAGDVSITFERVDGSDAGDARTGTFTGTFQAPLVEERNAEQNLALLAVTDVLGLPLGPRAEAP
jgi:hypothetical protein